VDAWTVPFLVSGAHYESEVKAQINHLAAESTEKRADTRPLEPGLPTRAVVRA